MKITVSNFLAYSKPVEFDLRKTNLFIGGNNCGKSTFAKLIYLMQSMRNWEWPDEFSFDIYGIEKFLPGTLSFEDLFCDLNRPIKVSVEFSLPLNEPTIKVDFMFLKNEKSLVDEHGIHKGGVARISSILIDNQPFYSRSENVLKLFLSGFRKAKVILNGLDESNEPGQDWSGVENLKGVIAHFGLVAEKQFSEEGILEYSLKNANDLYTLHKYFIRPLLNPFLDLLRNELNLFSLIQQENFVKSINQYDRPDIIDSIKRHFGAEIVYRSVYRDSGTNNSEKKLIRKDAFVSYKKNEVPIESMGLGFRNLYQILFTEASHSISSRTEYKNHIPIYQEPEIGLHPDWQVKLFKLIKRGIIETHSLIILRALQLEVAEGNFSSEDVMIHNFYRDENDEIEVKQIRVLKSGILSDDFESGFQDELVQIEHKLWQIQQKLINRN